MTNKLNLSDNALIITIGQGIASAVTFLSGMFLVRLTSKEGYGTYMQVLLVYSILSSILSMGIYLSIYYFMPRLSDEERKVFAWQTIAVSLFLGFILSIILYLASGMFSIRFNNPELKLLLRIYFLFPIFSYPNSCSLPFLIVANRCPRAAVIEVISVILLDPLSVLVPLTLGYDLTLVFQAKVVSAGFIFLILLFNIFKIYGKPPKFSIKLLLSQFRYSLPLGLSSIAGFISKQLDKILISALFPVASFAIYSRGAFEIPLIDVLAGSVMTVVMPELSKLHKEDRHYELLRLWHESMRKVALILFPLSVFLFITARNFITLLYSENYADSVNIFRIYLFLLPLRITIYGNVLLATGRSKIILMGSILGLVSNATLNIICIKLFSLYGPAIAFVLAVDILTLFYLFKIKSALNVKFIHVFPWFTLARNMLVSCIAGIFICPIAFLELPKLVSLILSGAIFALIYGLASFKLNVIHQNDLDLAKRWVALRVMR
ncbi:MAG: oligosaccharide flippase family protein [bacterium]